MALEIEHAILQQLLHHRVLSKEKFDKIIKKLSKSYGNRILLKINKRLDMIGFEIIHTQKDDDRSEIYGLIDHNQDDITNESNNLDTSQILIFKKALDYIIQNTDTELTFDHLVEVATSELKISNEIAKSNNILSLGDLALIAVKYKLKGQYLDKIKNCLICKDILLSVWFIFIT
ncbi:hypothetical protein HZS_3419 [Henneguya salminicola]|nr:hypothetical protein HZS_3419 [Henneguya salminicola]